MNAFDRAVGYIGFKPRTKMQTIKYLREKGYEEDEICDAIETLQEYNYIDDLNFARMYFEQAFDKGRGAGRIKRELTEKGVPQDVIDEAFCSLDNAPDQYEIALQIGRQIVEGAVGIGDYAISLIAEMDYKEKEKLKAKIVRRLLNRGFSSDIAYGVARELTRRGE